MKKAILFFTSKKNLVEINFIILQTPEIETFQRYLSPNEDQIYLVNDELAYDEFKAKIWNMINIDFEVFGYVYHRKPYDDKIKIHLNTDKRLISIAIEGEHEKDTEKGRIYRSLKGVVIRNGHNPNKTLTQAEFNSIWKNFDTRSKTNDRIKLLDAICKGKSLDEISIPVAISQNEEMAQVLKIFKSKVTPSFDVDNQIHEDLLNDLRDKLLNINWFNDLKTS